MADSTTTIRELASVLTLE